jgi:hypothetical protein
MGTDTTDTERTGCIPSDGSGTAPPPGSRAGFVTADERLAGAPAYYEVGTPSGAFEGRSPVGVMMVVHGGGWSVTGK